MVSAKAVRQALYTRLNVASVTSQLANGSASLHHAVVPSSGEYPLVVFNQVSGVPTHSFGGSHYDSQLWLVKAIAKGGSSSTAEDIAEDIADRLDFAPLSITGADDMHVMRESAVVFAEEVDGEIYRHHGDQYRILFQDS